MKNSLASIVMIPFEEIKIQKEKIDMLKKEYNDIIYKKQELIKTQEINNQEIIKKLHETWNEELDDITNSYNEQKESLDETKKILLKAREVMEGRHLEEVEKLQKI